MEQFKHKFIDEAMELIQDLEKSSLELSTDLNNPAHIEVIFRAMHSLKGGSAMFGFDKIDAFTHQLEAAYDKVRKGKMIVTEPLLDLTFKAIDHIKVLLSEDDKLSDATRSNHAMLLNSISSMLNDKQEQSKAEEIQTVVTEAEGKGKTFYVQFIPKREIMRNGTNPLLIVQELASLGESKSYVFTSEIPPYEEFDIHSCYVSWVTILHTEAPEDTVRDVFMFVDMDCELVISVLSGANLLLDSRFIQKLDERYQKNESLDLGSVQSLMDVPQKLQTEEEIAAAGTAQVKAREKEQTISSLRVSSEKLDELINLVSELVTRQASLSLATEKLNSKELTTIAEDIEKITRRLRDSTFAIRLIPVDNMVTRFQRLVRELSHELNKSILFQTEGTETELDKTIIEGLIDPIMHIIRNSIDHGIESGEERIKNGKSEQGTIKLKAFYSGANVYIQVSDDGKGINREKVLQKAIQQGLITKESELSDKEILELLFLPGFSTAENVTKVSGRGVGMDVVKRKISYLRGEVSIDSAYNVGTTITIKLPLTLSIIDGLLVMIEDTYFVVPLTFVNRCLEIKHSELENAINNMIFVNDGHIPLVNLRKEFEIESPSPEVEQVLVVEYGDMLIGMSVDEVIGEYQAVLKSLGSLFKDQDNISGATILGDGTVALVVDPGKIISQFSYQIEESEVVESEYEE